MRKKNFTGYYVKRGLATVATLAFATWWMFGDSWSASSAEKEGVRGWLQRMPIYAANARYMDELLDKRHDAAFRAAYTAGGRRRVARMDRESYLRDVILGMADDAAHDSQLDIAKALRDGYEVLVNR